MSNPFSSNNQIGMVSTFSELVHTDFKGEINALCWYRNLDGDFNEIVTQLSVKENVTEVYAHDLIALQLSEKGNIAREIILNDLQVLTDFGASPSLNLIKCYERDDEFDFISTDVYSFHVDRSPIATDTFLCTYHGAASDIVSNSQAEQKILIPEIRAKLKELHNGPSEEFENFLKENYFDLHYQIHADVKPINLGLMHLWRLAVDHPKQKVLPCIHRAPLENEGEYRLLLIC
ncbi:MULTISPECIES: DUF1826 domain-containing protein [Flavobacterium]|uniref:DUF1826 domain-containing protein n=1 Tax=Flavobacterium salmonis TaxID=2654844 RepID=A0A6V6Z4E1_9FLAO|nr:MULTISPECIES: DUF1826 domain-containing protein [Flavobacterium]OOV17283.1 DUF1826 domain-containing protein [Flavobacterium sp. LM4]CAD0006658.1 hypothetical protein FLAT13_03413 [Flavobacterium salmonis]